MDIIYLDPGYGKNMEVTSGEGLTCVESDVYNPHSGVAFTGSDCTAYFPVPVPSTALNHVGIKFSVYCENMTTEKGFVAQINTTTRQGYKNRFVNVTIKKGSCVSTAVGNGTNLSLTNFNDGFHDIALNVYWRNLARYNFVEADGTRSTLSFTQATENPSSYYYPHSFFVTFPPATAGTFYISNVIYATATVQEDDTSPAHPLLSSDKQIVRLPLGTPVTDFTKGDNDEYIGTEEGQTLLQTIDASSLITKYEGKSKVIGLASYGNPGYRVGSPITQAAGISKSGDTITSHGKTEISTETDATAHVAWETPNTTLSDIDGLQVGWQI